MCDSLQVISKTSHNLYCIVCSLLVTKGLFFLDFDELSDTQFGMTMMFDALMP